MLNSAEVRIRYDLSDAYEKLEGFAATLADVTGRGAEGGTARPEQRASAANTREYKIGDRGPANGLIFYDKGTFSNGWRYLEAAPVETELNAEWGPRESVDGTATVVGSGRRNTELIVEFLRREKESNQAAQVCEALDIDGYADWFLPSKDELNLLYTNLKEKGLGEFSDNVYWSSSEYGRTMAWAQRFRDGRQFISGFQGGLKNFACSVRAIRAF
jgi:hypothetical protein